MLAGMKGILARKLACKVSTRHVASKHGRPVILDEYGEPMSDIDGLRSFLEIRNYSLEKFSDLVGRKWSPRAIRSWLQGTRSVPTDILNVLRDILENERSAVLAKRLPRMSRATKAMIKDFMRCAKP
jgi:hypothetical protein